MQFTNHIGAKLTILDFTMQSTDVLELLADLFVERDLQEYIRSDNGPEFTAAQIRTWLERLGVGTLFIESGIVFDADGGQGSD